MRTKSSRGERLELDADREAALQLRDEVRDLRDVERAGGDEEHVIGLHRAVLRAARSSPRRSAGDRAARPRARRRGRRLAPLRVRRSCRSRRGRRCPPARCARRPRAARGPCRRACSASCSDITSIASVTLTRDGASSCRLKPGSCASMSRRSISISSHAVLPEDLHQRRLLRLDVELDVALVELACAQLLPELRDRSTPERSRRQAAAAPASRTVRTIGGGCGDVGLRRARHVFERDEARRAAPRRSPRALAHGLRSPRAHQLDRVLDEVAHDRLDVATDVADLGELARPRPSRTAPCASLARRRAISVLPTPVGPIMMMFFGAISSRSSAGTLLPAPAIAERDRRPRASPCLADDVAVELADDLARREAAARSRAELLDARSGRSCRRRSRDAIRSARRAISRRGELGVPKQRARRRERVGAARADRDHAARRARSRRRCR